MGTTLDYAAMDSALARDGKLTYAFTLYDDNNTPSDPSDDRAMGSYDDVLTAAPYSPNYLQVNPAAVFATFTAPSPFLLSTLISGGRLPIAWTLPAGMRVDGASVQWWSAGTSPTHIEVDKDLDPAATGATIELGTFAFTPAGAIIFLEAEDRYGREFVSSIWTNS